MVTEAGGLLPLQQDADLLYRSQAEASDTLTRGSLPDAPQGVIKNLILAAGTGPQTLTKSALAGTDQIDHLAAGMPAELMAVSMTAGTLTGTLFRPNQKGVSVMIEKPLMRKEAHAARIGSHRLTQRMTSMTCQEAAGRAMSVPVALPCVIHACHSKNLAICLSHLRSAVWLALTAFHMMLLKCTSYKQQLDFSSQLLLTIMLGQRGQ